MQARLVRQQGGQVGVELADRQRLVHAECLAGGFGAIAIAVPDLPLHVLGAAKEDRARRVARKHYQHRLGFAKSREVVEIAVEAVGKLGVAIACHFGRRRNHGNTAAAGGHLRQQAGTSRPELLDVPHVLGSFCWIGQIMAWPRIARGCGRLCPAGMPERRLFRSGMEQVSF